MAITYFSFAIITVDLHVLAWFYPWSSTCTFFYFLIFFLPLFYFLIFFLPLFYFLTFLLLPLFYFLTFFPPLFYFLIFFCLSFTFWSSSCHCFAFWSSLPTFQFWSSSCPCYILKFSSRNFLLPLASVLPFDPLPSSSFLWLANSLSCLCSQQILMSFLTFIIFLLPLLIFLAASHAWLHWQLLRSFLKGRFPFYKIPQRQKLKIGIVKLLM